jgi:hypothetical protein
MSRLPPIPEEVQRNSRNQLRPFFRFGVGLIVLGIAAAVSGLVGVTGDATRVALADRSSTLALADG